MLPLAQAIARVFAQARRKEKSQPRAHQVPGSGSGHREIQGTGAGRAQDSAARSALDRIREGRRAVRGSAAASRRQMARFRARRPSSAGSKTNTRPQKQAGYVTVTVALPLGDITANQLRSLADIVRRFTKETIRTTVEQNFVIRWVSQSDLPEIYKALEAVGLGDPGAGAIVDIVTCPGTDTCKLGISSSRGLAARAAQSARREKLSVGRGRCRICTSRSAAASIVAASITWPTSVSTASAARSADTPCLTFRWCWAANGSTTAVLTACRSWRFRRRDIPEVVTRLTGTLCRRPHDRRELQGFHQAHRQSGIEKHAGGSRASRPPIQRTARSSAIGAIRANTRWATWASANAPEKWSPPSSSIWPPPSAKCSRRRWRWRAARVEQARNTAYQSMLHAAKGAREDRESRTSRTIPTRSSPNSARATTTRRNSGIPSPAENSPITCSTRTQKAGEPYTADSARYLIDEAQLFIDAAHSCYNKLGAAVPA